MNNIANAYLLWYNPKSNQYPSLLVVSCNKLLTGHLNSTFYSCSLVIFLKHDMVIAFLLKVILGLQDLYIKILAIILISFTTAISLFFYFSYKSFFVIFKASEIPRISPLGKLSPYIYTYLIYLFS